MSRYIAEGERAFLEAVATQMEAKGLDGYVIAGLGAYGLTFTNNNTGASGTVQLYNERGSARFNMSYKVNGGPEKHQDQAFKLEAVTIDRVILMLRGLGAY